MCRALFFFVITGGKKRHSPHSSGSGPRAGARAMDKIGRGRPRRPGEGRTGSLRSNEAWDNIKGCELSGRGRERARDRQREYEVTPRTTIPRRVGRRGPCSETLQRETPQRAPPRGARGVGRATHRGMMPTTPCADYLTHARKLVHRPSRAEFDSASTALASEERTPLPQDREPGTARSA